MKYISGIHALNLNCDLATCGDWHQSALKWDYIKLYESENSLWNDYGIESNKSIPEHEETYHVANHIRALLDLLYDKNFALARGMNHNFIANEKYDNEIFNQVLVMKNLDYWDEINDFMSKEYTRKWFRFLKDMNLK